MRLILGLPPDSRILFSTRVLRLFAYGFLSVILALYLSAAGLAEGQIGLLFSINGLMVVGLQYFVTRVLQTRRLTDFVTDTKYIVPTSFRPKDNVAHVLRWWITPVRQTGTDDQGQSIWSPSGAVSDKRVFSWVGIAVEGTPSP